MKKPPATPNAPSTVTCVKPKYGMARHRQQIKSGWAAERHDAPAATARQPAAKRKPGSYGGR
jgi:hypothetical protein